MFNRVELKEKAKEDLKGNWSYLAGLYVLILGITVMITFIAEQIPFAGSIGASLITAPMSAAGIFIAMALYKKREIPVKIIFEGFNHFGRVLGLYWWIALWTFLWSLIVIIPMFFIIVMVLAASYSYQSAAAVFVVFFILIIICFIPIYIKMLSYSMSYFVLLSEPKIGVIEAMNESKRITKGNIGKLFLLDLSFIGWIILAIIPCGLGFIVLTPYMNQAKYRAFRVIKEEMDGYISYEERKEADIAKIREEIKKRNEAESQ